MVLRVRAWAAGAVLGLVALGSPGVAAAVTAAPAPSGPLTVAAVVNRSTATRVDSPSIEHFTVPDQAAARHLLADLRADGEVVSADVDHPVRVFDDGAATAAGTLSNDTLRPQQWALTAVHAEGAWASSTGTGEVVAVVDTGTDVTHPDLAGQVLPGAEFITQTSTSTGDGSDDQNGHGTHVSGIVAALANNNMGVAGLAPGVRILPVRVLDEDGTGWSSDIARGIMWAADHGADVINLSLGSTADDANMKAAIAYAHDTKGVVVTAAAGNAGAGANATNYPAADPGVIAVASTTSTGARSSFSNYGSYVDIAAPGSTIMSTYPMAFSPSASVAYASMSGTSMASPYVAAAAALVRARYGLTDPDAVEARLEATALDLGTAGRDDQFGNGQVDALAAVCPVTAAVASPTVPTAVAASVVSGGVQVSWTAPSCLGGTRNVSYQVTATPVGGGAGLQSTTAATTTVLTGLPASTTYSLAVVATNSAGSSPSSGTVQVTTPAPGASPPPTTTSTTAPLVIAAPTTTTTAAPMVTTTTSTTVVTTPPSTVAPTATTVPAAPSRTNNGGYWVAGADASVASFGTAAAGGSNGPLRLNQPIVGMTASRTGRGYWLVATDGGIFSFGDATFFGSTGGLKLNKPIVGMAATPTGHGYWFVAADGGIFAFGDAAFFGSTGGLKLNQPIVGMAATPTGNGYWLVARDGGIFAFGDARFFGSTGAIKLNQPIVGMTATPTGHGYWFVAADGGIFSYGDAGFLGSTGGVRLPEPIVGMSAADLHGYWLVSADGRVFAFGDAINLGSARPGAVTISA